MIRVLRRNILTVIIISICTSILFTVSACIGGEQPDQLFELFLLFALPYSLLFVFLYGFIASMMGEIIALLIPNNYRRFHIKIVVYGLSLTLFFFGSREIEFFAYLGIIAAIFYVLTDEYLRKRPQFNY